MTKRRESFSSRFGIIAAAAGSAVGLGNIWRFPYITGKYGGGSFLIIYLLCILVIGMPIMLSEFIIGRKTHKSAIGAFRQIAPKEPWVIVGWMGIASSVAILSVYGVVAGWCLNYVFKAVMNSFSGKTSEELGYMFTMLRTNPIVPIVCQLVFMFLTGYIVLSGVQKGIEKYSKILMPLLVIIIIILDIRAITLDGAKEGLMFLFSPDWSKISGQAFIVALGQAAFTLSVGMGTMITYGSYISKNEKLGPTVIQVGIADTLIALLAGISIFPAVFTYGIQPDEGAGLAFIALPNVFLKLPGGYILGVLFFVLLAIAALTSSISMLEVPVAYLCEELKLTRKKATVLATSIIAVVGVMCSLSNGPWQTEFFGKSLMDLLDFAAANVLLPLGGLIIALFVGWRMKKSDVQHELNLRNESIILNIFRFAVKIIVPIGISLVFLNSIGIIK